VSKTTVIYVKFLRDAACQKLLKSANVSRSYSKVSLANEKNNTGTVFLRHRVVGSYVFFYDRACMSSTRLSGKVCIATDHDTTVVSPANESSDGHKIVISNGGLL